MLSARNDLDQPLLINGSSDINGSLFSDAIVQRHSSLHVRGNLIGNLTIEPGASVIVEGSIDGKVINRGGRLVVNNKGIAGLIRTDGPPEPEAGGVLRIDLSAIGMNWEAVAKRTVAECAAVVKADAYGCGIDSVAAALATTGCKTFFVSDLAEAKRVRAVAPNANIYVLNGMFPDTGPAFAAINAQPVIRSLVEMSQWDAFVASSRWQGGFALYVDAGMIRHGLTMEEAIASAARIQAPPFSISLLMSHLENVEKQDHSLIDRQISQFQDLRRLYGRVPASLANSAGIFLGSKTHCDVVRPGSALYGLNPTPGQPNPMMSAIELRARIMHICALAPGETVENGGGWTAKLPTRVAIVSIGYADGFARAAGAAAHSLQAIVGGKLCPIRGRPSMDSLAIDVSALPPGAARHGEMVTLVGGEISLDALAVSAKSTGWEVLASLGRRYHRVYYAS
jgi:alanine racemase